MTEIAEDRPKPPKAPRPLHVVACLLEIAIVAAFFSERSIVGLVLCLGYSWFSATWALFRPEEPD